MSHRLVARIGFAIAAVTLLAVPFARADWQPPKDNVYTEDQLNHYLDAAKESMAALTAAGKAAENTNNGIAAMAIVKNLDEKQKAIIVKNKLDPDEYRWLTEQTWTAWGALVMSDMFKQADSELKASVKKSDDQIAAATKKVAAYEDAVKTGRRVFNTPEDRDAAIKDYKDQQQAAVDEAKGHADEAKAAEDEAKTHDGEAKTAQDAINHPSADLNADEKQSFIDGKKSELDNANQAAKDARVRAADARQAEKDSKAKAAGLDARVKDPEAPVTDDEKAQYKQQATDGLDAAKAELTGLTQAAQMVKDSIGTNQKSMDEAISKVPAGNLALLAKHRDQFEKTWNLNTQKK